MRKKCAEKECFTKGFSTKNVLPRDSGMQLGGGVPNSLLEGATMHSGEGLCIKKTQLCASIQAYNCAKHTMHTYMASHIHNVTFACKHITSHSTF